MKSKKRLSNKLSDITLKITQEDIAALQKKSKGLSTEDYLKFLKKFPLTATIDLKRRKGPRGKMFKL